MLKKGEKSGLRGRGAGEEEEVVVVVVVVMVVVVVVEVEEEEEEEERATQRICSVACRLCRVPSFHRLHFRNRDSSILVLATLYGILGSSLLYYHRITPLNRDRRDECVRRRLLRCSKTTAIRH